MSSFSSLFKSIIPSHFTTSVVLLTTLDRVFSSKEMDIMINYAELDFAEKV